MSPASGARGLEAFDGDWSKYENQLCSLSPYSIHDSQTLHSCLHCVQV